MDFDGGVTPHLNRKYSDYWAIRQSGVTVHDGTTFLGLEDNGKDVIVRARREGREVRYQARFVIGADGPKSAVTKVTLSGLSKKHPLVYGRPEVSKDHRMSP